MTREQEQILIEKVRGGDTACYKSLVDEYGERLFALLKGLVGSREDAQDLAQEAFVKAFFSLKKFRGDSSFSTWLYRIGYNLAISKLRKEKGLFADVDINHLRVVDDSDGLLEQKRLSEREYELLEMAKGQLPAQERFLLCAFYEQERSLAELVQITGLSLSNIKVKLFRARKRLSNLVSGAVAVTER